ncbi:hypothetical protein FRC03_008697 [Tulasnella sp. 419]|nr:hypothetical protein FRC03_008697 [Tulasnella sp. 419]
MVEKLADFDSEVEDEALSNLGQLAASSNREVDELEANAFLGYVLVHVSHPVQHGYFNPRPIEEEQVIRLVASIRQTHDKRYDYPAIGVIYKDDLDTSVVPTFDIRQAPTFKPVSPNCILHGLAGQHRFEAGRRIFSGYTEVINDGEMVLRNRAPGSEGYEKAQSDLDAAKEQRDMSEYWPMKLYDGDLLPSDATDVKVVSLLTRLSTNKVDQHYAGGPREQWGMARRIFEANDKDEFSLNDRLAKAVHEFNGSKDGQLFTYSRTRRVIFKLLEFDRFDKEYRLNRWLKKSTEPCSALVLLLLEDSFRLLTTLFTVDGVVHHKWASSEIFEVFDTAYQTSIGDSYGQHGKFFMDSAAREDYVNIVYSELQAAVRAKQTTLPKRELGGLKSILGNVERILNDHLQVPVYCDALCKDLQVGASKMVRAMQFLEPLVDLGFGLLGSTSKGKNKRPNAAEALIEALDMASMTLHNDSEDRSHPLQNLSDLLAVVMPPPKDAPLDVKTLESMSKAVIQQLIPGKVNNEQQSLPPNHKMVVTKISKAIQRCSTKVDDVIKGKSTDSRVQLFQEWYYTIERCKDFHEELMKYKAAYQVFHQLQHIKGDSEDSREFGLVLLMSSTVPAKEEGVLDTPESKQKSEGSWTPLESALKRTASRFREVIREIKDEETTAKLCKMWKEIENMSRAEYCMQEELDEIQNNMNGSSYLEKIKKPKRDEDSVESRKKKSRSEIDDGDGNLRVAKRKRRE